MSKWKIEAGKAVWAAGKKFLTSKKGGVETISAVKPGTKTGGKSASEWKADLKLQKAKIKLDQTLEKTDKSLKKLTETTKKNRKSLRDYLLNK